MNTPRVILKVLPSHYPSLFTTGNIWASNESTARMLLIVYGKAALSHRSTITDKKRPGLPIDFFFGNPAVSVS